MKFMLAALWLFRTVKDLSPDEVDETGVPRWERSWEEQRHLRDMDRKNRASSWGPMRFL